MSVSRSGRDGRPPHRPRGNDPAIVVLIVVVSVLLGVLATTSTAWAIGIPVSLAALPVIVHFVNATGRNDRADPDA